MVAPYSSCQHGERSILSQNKTQEFAGKTIAEARALAARYGFTAGGYLTICGPLCVIRFKDAPASPLGLPLENGW